MEYLGIREGPLLPHMFADHDPTNPTMKRATFSMAWATGPLTGWPSGAAPVWGNLPESGAPAASGGRRRGWPTVRVRAADDGASARSPRAAPPRPPAGPRDSWPPAPGTDRSARPNRRACPAGPTRDRSSVPRSIITIDDD